MRRAAPRWVGGCWSCHSRHSCARRPRGALRAAGVRARKGRLSVGKTSCPTAHATWWSEQQADTANRHVAVTPSQLEAATTTASASSWKTHLRRSFGTASTRTQPSLAKHGSLPRPLCCCWFCGRARTVCPRCPLSIGGVQRLSKQKGDITRNGKGVDNGFHISPHSGRHKEDLLGLNVGELNGVTASTDRTVKPVR